MATIEWMDEDEGGVSSDMDEEVDPPRQNSVKKPTGQTIKISLVERRSMSPVIDPSEKPRNVPPTKQVEKAVSAPKASAADWTSDSSDDDGAVRKALPGRLGNFWIPVNRGGLVASLPAGRGRGRGKTRGRGRGG